MKRLLHLLVLAGGSLLAAGVIYVLVSPSPRPSDPSFRPTPPPPAGRVSLFLGTAPASPSERSSYGEFVFGETIYATVVIDRVAPGDHLITFRWINPREGVQETFRRPFYSPGGGYRGWSWLELRGEEWLPLSLGPLGPGRFLGSWRVEIDLDGAVVARSGFTVR